MAHKIFAGFFVALLTAVAFINTGRAASKQQLFVPCNDEMGGMPRRSQLAVDQGGMLLLQHLF